MGARMNSANLKRPGATRIISTTGAALLAVMLAAEPVGALDLAGKVSAQAPAASVSPSRQVVKKRRYRARRPAVARYGRHLYPYPYYPPCPYYFQAYGTYPCFAQGYYPYPAYSYGFGFGGPFWRGGFGDDD
jgi:hypothetical protein